MPRDIERYIFPPAGRQDLRDIYYGPVQDSGGNWVLYQDYASLEARCLELEQQNATLRAALVKFENRAMEIEAWLLTNYGECFEQQRHLDTGSTERTYWHFGYLVALRDMREALADGGGKG